MTAQITDKICYSGLDFDLIGIAGSGMPTPQDFGMLPVMIHTACYRGFYAAFSVLEEGLVLVSFTLREKDGNYGSIQGSSPSIDEYNIGHYNGLSLPVPFTGKTRIARDFIREMYVHMGFQKPESYRCVFDLDFKAGKLLEAVDISAELEQFRIQNGSRSRASTSNGELDDTFSLDM